MRDVVRILRAGEDSLLWRMLYHALYIPAGQPALPEVVVRHPNIARYVQNWGRVGDVGLVIEETPSREPIGALWLRRFTAADPGFGFVADDIPELSMAVQPEYRGKGAGTQLLRALVESEHAERPISLSVAAENPAVRLYRRFGFQEVNRDATSLVMLREPR